MSITQSQRGTQVPPPAPGTARPSSHDLTHVRPYVPPPRIIVGLLTGDGELVAGREPAERRRDR